MQVHVMPSGSVNSRGIVLTDPCPVSSLDNGEPTRPFRSELLAHTLALDPPQREQQIDLFISERLALDFGENGLKVGSNALACIGFETRTGHLVIRIGLGTHWATCWYSAPSKMGCEPAS